MRREKIVSARRPLSSHSLMIWRSAVMAQAPCFRLPVRYSLSRSHADFPVAGHVRDVQFALSQVKGDVVLSKGKRRHGDIAGVTGLVGMDADHPIYGVNLKPQEHLQ